MPPGDLGEARQLLRDAAALGAGLGADVVHAAGVVALEVGTDLDGVGELDAARARRLLARLAPARRAGVVAGGFRAGVEAPRRGGGRVAGGGPRGALDGVVDSDEVDFKERDLDRRSAVRSKLLEIFELTESNRVFVSSSGTLASRSSASDCGGAKIIADEV